MQAAVVLISKAIKNNRELQIKDKIFTFRDTMLRNKIGGVNDNHWEKRKIYCPQLKTVFNSHLNMAEFIVDNKLWGNITVKTAKLRISDLTRGYFKHYKNYQCF